MRNFLIHRSTTLLKVAFKVPFVILNLNVGYAVYHRMKHNTITLSIVYVTEKQGNHAINHGIYILTKRNIRYNVSRYDHVSVETEIIYAETNANISHSGKFICQKESGKN